MLWYVECYVVQMDSTAIDLDRTETACNFSLISLAETVSECENATAMWGGAVYEWQQCGEGQMSMNDSNVGRGWCLWMTAMWGGADVYEWQQCGEGLMSMNDSNVGRGCLWMTACGEGLMSLNTPTPPLWDFQFLKFFFLSRVVPIAK